MNGITGEGNIANMWRDHFDGVMNSVNNDIDSIIVNEALNRENDDNDDVYTCELRTAVNQLKNGEAVGKDGIPAEVFKYGPVQLLYIMSIFSLAASNLITFPNY